MSKTKRHKNSDKNNKQQPQLKTLSPDTGKPFASGRSVNMFIFILLLLLGIYHSVTYFGHQVVPTSDFTGFVRVGREILSFHLPSTYKRLPVLGMLQVCISSLVGGNHPDLTAGWLLNAILHPFNIVLIWLIARKLIGRVAVWVAIVAAINPWTLRMLADPIVETTLLFFTLLSFYFITRRSKWAYLFASITSMVRYEGALLIFVAFLMDMIYAENKKQRIHSFIYAVIASVPLGLWLLGTIINWASEGEAHYLKGTIGPRTGGKIVFIEYIGLIWQMGFQPLFMLEPAASKDSFETLFGLSKVITACSFAFGMLYSLIKRHWQMLGLFVFLLLYLFIHAVQASIIPRHGVAVYWLVLIICAYGFRSLWQLINKSNRVPKTVTIALQIILLLTIAVWLFQLVPYLPKLARMSPSSKALPYVSAAGAALVFAAFTFLYRKRFLLHDLLLSALVCLVIASNQLVLVQVIGTGRANVEFKMLADWYLENAKDGEKLLSTMANVARLYASEHKDDFVHTGSIKTDDPVGFAKECYQKDITYIAWDSRLGLSPNDLYYERWRLKNIAALAYGKDVGPYEFVTQIRASKRRFINIFRLKHPPPGQFTPDPNTQ